jgi:phosphoribosylformylglycinamidine cyclo-ligase
MGGESAYEKAGVHLKRQELWIQQLQKRVQGTYGKQVFQGIGGFASLYRLDEKRLIVASADGVGTKIKIAQQLNQHQGIGVDLVAMCVNDLLCTGATPLFFMDYLALGTLDIPRTEAILEGILKGCQESQMVLIGGETAEMPGMYAPEEYDLAGFVVGEVLEEQVLDGKNIKQGDSLIGIASSGLHSKALLQACLTPTRIYASLVRKLLEKHRPHLKGMAHLTGGGWQKILRLHPQKRFHLTSLPSFSEIDPLFQLLQKRASLRFEDCYSTFNMGVGFVCCTDRPQELLDLLQEEGERAWILGRVEDGGGALSFEPSLRW